MKTQELRNLIREEVRKVLKEYFVRPEMTIGDVLVNGKSVAQGGIANWVWTSIPAMKSYNWRGFNMAPKFQPLLKQLEKYKNENVVDFFGMPMYKKLEKLQYLLNASDGRDHKPAEYKKAFDEIYAIVTKTLEQKQ